VNDIPTSQANVHLLDMTLRLNGVEVGRKAMYINKQTPWTLVRKRTIPSERPLLVGEI
jgi:hypothetical protein